MDRRSNHYYCKEEAVPNYYRFKKYLVCSLSVFLFACQPADQEGSKDEVVEKELIKKEQFSEQQIKAFANQLQVTYEVVDNRPDGDCDPKKYDGNCFRGAITLKSPVAFSGSEWRIYFSQMSPIFKDFSEAFDVVHHQGDLHYIEPTEKLTTFNAEESYRIEFKGGFWQISEHDSPPNFYLVYKDAEPVTIESTRAIVDAETGLEYLPHVKAFENKEKQFKRTAEDKSPVATAAYLYERNQSLEQSTLDVSSRLIPQPTSITADANKRKLDISEGLKLPQNSLGISLENPAVQRLLQLGVIVNQESEVAINIEKETGLAKEAYELVISERSIDIKASDSVGAFYALQSIAGLYQVGNNDLPLLRISDHPRYSFRGLHLDVARNFRSKAFVFKLLDQMSAYKLNKLHLHLGDDEGWRVEIPDLPELTKLGAFRCHDLTESNCLLPQLGAGIDKQNSNNGFYSITDYQEILKAASERNIQVIPSFDMPGHSRAAVKSMQLRYKNLVAQGKLELAEEFLLSDPQDKSQYSSVQFYSDNTINVCRESSYHFLEKVVSEVALMHKNAGVPMDIYHIGADETPGAWKESPDCKAFMALHDLEVEELGGYFIERVSLFLEKEGIKVAAWNDGLAEVKVKNMPSSVQANAWTPLFWDGHKAAHKMANQGWDVVVSIPDVTYFDFPYEADPKERGYYWGSRFTNTRQVFEFMPDNLPIHAEIWGDRQSNPMELDDTKQLDESGKLKSEPLKKGKSFVGMQAHLWSEMVRSDQIAEYLLFPRLMAIAERAWHKAEWEPEYIYEGAVYSKDSGFFTQENKRLREADWRVFANLIGQKEMAKLERADWLFRLPTIGALVEDERLKISSPFPGLKIEYRFVGEEWKRWDGISEPLTVKGKAVEVRAISPNEKRKGRSLLVN